MSAERDAGAPRGAAAGPSTLVVLVGHGETASHLLAAARRISPGGLDDVIAVNAGEGDCAALERALADACGARPHEQRLFLVDVFGSSPWRRCAGLCGEGPETVTVGGLSLAMLLKLASLDRDGAGAKSIAEACVASARRATLMDGDCRE